ncbi:MAG: tetratricopeptide repeat protein [Phycisphaerae bacterium]
MKRTLAILAAALALGLVASTVRAGIGIGTVEEDPEVTHEKWKRKAEEDYKTGMEALAAGKTGQAVKFLMRAYDIGRRYRIDSPYPQKAADELVKLSREGLRELDVARDLVGGEAPRAGLLELKRITRTYLGLQPARQAGALLRQLEGAPTFQARLRASELAEQLARAEALETRAAALAAEADLDDVRGKEAGGGERASGTKPAESAPESAPEPAAEAAGHPHPSRSSALPTEPPLPDGVDAADVAERSLSPSEREARRLDLLAEAHTIYARVAEAGKGTEVGTNAEAARRRLEQDADLMARIRRARQQDQAREWLSLGTNYMRAGRMDKAREFFQKIVAECPDTPQAREARGFLGGMSK